jgi:hypothetical protein
MEYEFKPMRQIMKLIGYCIGLVFIYMIGDYVNPNLELLFKLSLGVVVIASILFPVLFVILYVFKPSVKI